MKKNSTQTMRLDKKIIIKSQKKPSKSSSKNDSQLQNWLKEVEEKYSETIKALAKI